MNTTVFNKTGKKMTNEEFTNVVEFRAKFNLIFPGVRVQMNEVVKKAAQRVFAIEDEMVHIIKEQPENAEKQIKKLSEERVKLLTEIEKFVIPNEEERKERYIPFTTIFVDDDPKLIGKDGKSHYVSENVRRYGNRKFLINR